MVKRVSGGLWLGVLTVVGLEVAPGPVWAAIPASERAALVALYESTRGDSWSRHDGWLGATGSECTWHGVVCDAAGEHVVELDLWSHNLSGPLPAQIGALPALAVAYLCCNHLTGPLPTELGDLKKLRTLYLYSNEINGSLPTTLGGMTALEDLRLATNQLSGAIPVSLGELAGLQHLDLSSNRLGGAIPGELGRLAGLRTLVLSANSLSGTIPAALGDATALETLDLSSNQLSGGVPDELGRLASLKHLRLARNVITGCVPAALGGLAALTELQLWDNRLSGQIPPELGRLGALTELGLAANQLTGAIPVELAALVELESLDLSSNQLTGAIPVELAALVELESLDLSSNQLTGAIPVELAALVKLKVLSLQNNRLTGAIPTELGDLLELEQLNLWSNALTGSIPARLGNLAKLQLLAACCNQLGGSIPPELGRLAELRNLYLYSNQLTGPLPAQLGQLGRLEGLHLSSNQLTGPLPEAFADLASLRELTAGANQISGAVPAWVSRLPEIETLNLCGNRLTGPIPAGLGAAPHLKRLYLCGNSLSGTIPDDLGEAGELVDLQLQENQLTGAIPLALGGLEKLRMLDLADNRLSGPLPAELGNLSSLNTLWMRNNELTGSVPAGFGRLVNLTEVDLSGNRLSGTIPPEVVGLPFLVTLLLRDNRLAGAIPEELGTADKLLYLDLRRNSLEGAIPASLGNLTTLQQLLLSGNLLSGPLPGSLKKLAGLHPQVGLDLRWNALSSPDPTVTAFLNVKQHGGDFLSTQTVAPTGVAVSAVTEHTATVTWTPITYQGDGGGYRVTGSTASGGPFTDLGTTTPKTAASLVVAGLAAGTTYHLAVQSMTPPHAENPNTVTSTTSQLVTATTAGTASPTVFPGVARASGANGTVWRSEAVLHNPSPAAVNVLLETVIRGGSTVTGSRAWDLQPGAVLRLGDLYAELGQAEGVGSARLRGGARAFLRTYNQGAAGTFGQDVVAGEEASFGAGDEVLFPVQTPRNPAAEFRSNLLLLNREASAITVTLSSGAVSRDFAVPAGAYVQLDKVGVTLGLSPGVSVLHATGSGAWSGTVSTVDPYTGDPATVRGQRRATRSTARFPGVASTPGANATVWRSQGTFYNATTGSVEVRLELVPRGGDAASATGSLTLQPGEVRQLDDLYAALDAPSGAGTLRVTGDVMAWLRTYNRGAAGSFGQDVVEATDNAFAAAAQVVFAIERPAELASGFRSNLLLLNLETRELAVTLRSGSHGHAVTVAPGTYTQLNNVGQLLGVPPGTAVVMVSADGAWSGSISTVDPGTGDPTTVRGLVLR